MMRFFSDELRDWAEYTYEVFVPERVRDVVFTATHQSFMLEKENVGEFEITSRRFSDQMQRVTFVPDAEPLRIWQVPLDVVHDALEAETYEDVEQLLINADEHSVLLEGE